MQCVLIIKLNIVWVKRANNTNMKLVIVSDLHLESYFERAKMFESMMKLDEVDYSDCVAIFAGDILTGYEAPKFLAQYKHYFKQILFVPGNHDLWYSDLVNVGEHELDIAGKSVVIDDVRFTGEVGWPIDHGRSYNPLDEIKWCTQLLERELITHSNTPFTYESMRWLGRDDSNHIFGEFEPTEKHVVVTHYPPSHKSIAPKFKDSDINFLFASNHDDYGLFVDCGIDLFIHGHTHNKVDYNIESTQVVSNPYGYNWEHMSFEPKIIEI